MANTRGRASSIRDRRRRARRARVSRGQRVGPDRRRTSDVGRDDNLSAHHATSGGAFAGPGIGSRDGSSLHSPSSRFRPGGASFAGVGIGVGRFAYTPIPPYTTAGLDLGKSEAGLIASANFLGCLLRALGTSWRVVPGDLTRPARQPLSHNSSSSSVSMPFRRAGSSG